MRQEKIMSPYYISEITFKNGDVLVIVRDANNEDYELRITMAANDFVNYSEATNGSTAIDRTNRHE
jgi:hypothetical protein